jgi:hypothetical protein
MNSRSFAPQWCWALGIAAVILGLFAVVAAYFWAHKPFDADVVAALARSLTSSVAWLAIERWLAGRRLQSALAMGVGGLVKWFPMLFLPVAVRFRRDWRESLGTVALALLVVVGVLGVLAVLSPTYTLASLRSLGSRASWQTVWALMDGNLGTGAYNANRLDPAAAALPQGHPARVPSWITVLLFGMLYFWLWIRPSCDLRVAACRLRLLRFTAVTVLLFFLWSRGWSPQWLGTLVPLVLLCLPLERAALYLVVLTFINIAEWPVLLSRGLDQWLYLTVLLRTGILALLVVELWRRIQRSAQDSSWKRSESVAEK